MIVPAPAFRAIKSRHAVIAAPIISRVSQPRSSRRRPTALAAAVDRRYATAIIAARISAATPPPRFHLTLGEPIASGAVNAPDGDCPKPPSPCFPVWNPRYLDGGAFRCRQAA